MKVSQLAVIQQNDTCVTVTFVLIAARAQLVLACIL